MMDMKRIDGSEQLTVDTPCFCHTICNISLKFELFIISVIGS